jgi:sugar phosphate isomerase/epimerase
MEIVIGCTTRPYAALPFAEACEHIASAGYTEVAAYINDGRIPVRSDSTPEEIAEARGAALSAGLNPSMLLGTTKLELGLDAAVEDFVRLIGNAAELGSEWLLECGTMKEDHYQDYYELMRRAMPHAEERGVKVVLKPHGGITLTIDDLLRAQEEVDHPSFGICYDPGNIIYYTEGEVMPEVGIERVAPLACAGIVKDCVVRDGEPDVMVTPGEGLVDFEKVLGGLVKGGFEGPLYVECVGGKEVDEIDENVRSTLEFVRGILAGL